MTTEKTTEEKIEKDEDRIGEALEKFQREAEGALAAFRVIQADIELRLKKAAEGRANEQSRVLIRLEEQIADIRATVGTQAGRIRETEQKHDELREAVRVVGKSITEARDQCASLIEECRKMRADAGPLFGAKLDAMGVQVAALAAMGDRLIVCETRSGVASRDAKAASGNCDLLDERLATAERAVSDLRASMTAKKTEPEKAVVAS